MNAGTLGGRIRARRLELAMTQKQLRDAADVSASFMSDVENDHRSPSAVNLYAIAKALGVTMDYLMSGEQRR